MNRAEWRRKQREDLARANETMIRIKQSEIDRIKQIATDQAMEQAFVLMLAIPTMVIHDKFGQILKKEVDGIPREARFADLCVEMYESFQQGYFTIEDAQQCLKEETGIDIKMKGERRR